MIEIALCLISGASVAAAIETGHWFATPFAMLFAFGYGYVAFFVAYEQLARRKAPPVRATTGDGSEIGATRGRLPAIMTVGGGAPEEAPSAPGPTPAPSRQEAAA
jgi:hypothetical protein